MALGNVQWYNPDGKGVFEKLHHKYISGTPYFEKTLDNHLLVIPTFNGSYDGVYICGIGNKFSYEEPKASVNLTLDGKDTYARWSTYILLAML